nr:NUDIX domain-containing protein [Motiliproteus sediminis]
MPAPKFSQADVTVSQRETLYDGFFRMERLRLQHALFEGETASMLSRELFVRDDAVCVLLYDPRRDAVVLVEQFRIGALDDEHSPWLLELVAGIVEPGEDCADVARREAAEEAAATLGRMENICRYHVSPGGSREVIHLLCAEVDSSGLGGVHGLADEGEDILVHVVDRADAYQGVVTGRINNAATIMALQWLQLNSGRLRMAWGA